MTKRGKKKSGKRSNEVSQSETGGDRGTIAEESNLHSGALHQNSGGHTVDLSFFRIRAQLYGELHQRLSRVSGEGYTEESVSQTGRKVLQALDDLAEALDPRSESKSPCPCVMLLSMLLPTLRKYLAWTQATRSLWGSNFVALRHHSTTSDGGALYRGEADTVLWAMLAQLDILTRFSFQTAHIVRLINSSESVDLDGTYPRPANHYSKPPKLTSQTSSASSSCSSMALTPRDSLDAGSVHTPRVTRDKLVSVPQIRHISMELANVDAECKIHLADLTESLVEVVEVVSCQTQTTIPGDLASSSWFANCV